MSFLSALFLGVGCIQAQEPLVRNYSVNLENQVVQRFMEEVSYEPGDASLVTNYKGSGVLYYPNPVVIDLPQNDADMLSVVCYVSETQSDSITFNVSAASGRAVLYNLIPQRIYNYEVKQGGQVLQHGEIVTGGHVRMIRVDGLVYNVRDLGGWLTEDGTQRIKYGKLFRGSELNWTHEATPEGLDTLRLLGVGAEIDMRAKWEANSKSNGHPETEGVSVFGFTNSVSTPSGEVPSYYYSNDSGMLPTNMSNYTWQYKWRQQFQFILKNLRVNRGVYYHCIYGFDRTGYLSILLEGLLGVSYSDMIKDFELSCIGIGFAPKKESLDEVIAYIQNLSGETLRDKFTTYFKNKLYATQADIDYFRSEMLEDVKEDVYTPTGIQEMQPQSAPANDNIYDLSGRRVNRQVRGGLYLVPDATGCYRQVFVK